MDKTSRAEMMSWVEEFGKKCETRRWKSIAEGLVMMGINADDDTDGTHEIQHEEWKQLIVQNCLTKLPKEGVKALQQYFRQDVKLHDKGELDEWGLVKGTITGEKKYAQEILDLLQGL